MKPKIRNPFKNKPVIPEEDKEKPLNQPNDNGNGNGQNVDPETNTNEKVTEGVTTERKNELVNTVPSKPRPTFAENTVIVVKGICFALLLILVIGFFNQPETSTHRVAEGTEELAEEGFVYEVFLWFRNSYQLAKKYRVFRAIWHINDPNRIPVLLSISALLFVISRLIWMADKIDGKIDHPVPIKRFNQAGGIVLLCLILPILYEFGAPYAIELYSKYIKK